MSSILPFCALQAARKHASTLLHPFHRSSGLQTAASAQFEEWAVAISATVLDTAVQYNLSARWAACTRPTLCCPAQGHLFPLAGADPRWRRRGGTSVLRRRRVLCVRASRGDSAACGHVGALSRRRAVPRGTRMHLKLTLENAATCYQLDTLARGDDHAYTASCCGWLRTSRTLAYWRPRGAAMRRTRRGGRPPSRATLVSMRDQTPVLVCHAALGGSCATRCRTAGPVDASLAVLRSRWSSHTLAPVVEYVRVRAAIPPPRQGTPVKPSSLKSKSKPGRDQWVCRGALSESVHGRDQGRRRPPVPASVHTYSVALLDMFVSAWPFSAHLVVRSSSTLFIIYAIFARIITTARCLLFDTFNVAFLARITNFNEPPTARCITRSLSVSTPLSCFSELEDQPGLPSQTTLKSFANLLKHCVKNQTDVMPKLQRNKADVGIDPNARSAQGRSGRSGPKASGARNWIKHKSLGSPNEKYGTCEESNDQAYKARKSEREDRGCTQTRTKVSGPEPS
ncbi:hypothetical protein GGX14DRAFT_396577 [Mycena pura]|uniref:Uncharacterized protein n=1 Tax=Mycena pura TaxID=153505 RepID=A0AAD6VA09_9AGAR|nr:hypothetical protein GGX14DRAFT_396577 [Mycena pura]